MKLTQKQLRKIIKEEIENSADVYYQLWDFLYDISENTYKYENRHQRGDASASFNFGRCSAAEDLKQRLENYQNFDKFKEIFKENYSMAIDTIRTFSKDKNYRYHFYSGWASLYLEIKNKFPSLEL